MSEPVRFKLLGAVYLILKREQDILLIRRYNTGWQDGNYSLASGHIDGHEPFSAAVCREAKEEVGISIKQQDAMFAHAMHRFDQGDLREYIDVFFVVTKWKGEPKNNEPNKCDEVRWCPIDKLPANIIPNVKQGIEYYQKHIPYSEYGW